MGGWAETVPWLFNGLDLTMSAHTAQDAGKGTESPSGCVCMYLSECVARLLTSPLISIANQVNRICLPS